MKHNSTLPSVFADSARFQAGTALIALSALFVKGVALDPNLLGLYRSASSAILYGACAMLTARGVIQRRDLGMSLLAGVFLYLDLTLWQECILILGAGLATLLNSLQVLFLTIHSWRYAGGRPSRRFLIALILAILGLCLITQPSHNVQIDHHRGVILGILSAGAYAGYVLSLRKLELNSATASRHARLAIVTAFGAFLFASERFLRHSLPFEFPVSGVLWACVYGVVGQFIPLLLITPIFSRMSSATVGLLLLGMPLWAYLWDALIFGFIPTRSELLGAPFIMLAIAIELTNRSRV